MSVSPSLHSCHTQTYYLGRFCLVNIFPGSIEATVRKLLAAMKLLLICILLLSYPLIFFRFLFYQYMVVFLFNIVIYVCLLKEFMYSYCCLCTCILIVRPCILTVVYVFSLLSMYSYCSSMYSYRCLCILIVVHVFLDAATLTEVFPCFFLRCKANARV